VFVYYSGKTDPEDTLNWSEIENTLNIIRENVVTAAETTKKYTSFKKYYDDTYKHRRKDVDPNQTFKSPVVYNQIYGFYNFKERDLNDIKFPKKKCEETKYQESIIMSGKEFMK
jgi:hypothetical protein